MVYGAAAVSGIGDGRRLGMCIAHCLAHCPHVHVLCAGRSCASTRQQPATEPGLRDSLAHKEGAKLRLADLRRSGLGSLLSKQYARKGNTMTAKATSCSTQHCYLAWSGKGLHGLRGNQCNVQPGPSDEQSLAVCCSAPQTQKTRAPHSALRAASHTPPSSQLLLESLGAPK